VFKKYVRDNDVPIHKLVAITTDGASVVSVLDLLRCAVMTMILVTL